MALTVKSLYHTYQPGTPNESHALKNIDLTIEEGEFVGIIGHTGSGKSTLVQHLNGLLKPTQGEVLLDGVNINAKSTKLKEIRLQVGLVFQYPSISFLKRRWRRISPLDRRIWVWRKKRSRNGCGQLCRW